MATYDFSIKDVEKVVKDIDGEIKNVSLTRLTASGENYLSLVFKVDIEVERNGETRIIRTVAKRLPLIKHGSFNFSGAVMKNEIRWYSEILPLLKEFAKENDLDCDYYPEFIGGRLSLDPEKNEADEESVLLLENLILQGYKNEDRYVGFDLKTSKSILRSLATFHVTPLVIKYKNSKLFNVLIDYIESCKPDFPPPEKDGPPGGERKSPPPEVRLIDNMLQIPAFQPYKERLEILRANPSGPMNWHKPGIEPWCTITHTDFWVNNLMVKPREVEDPLVKIVDFQLCGYSSYAKDLIFFLLTSIRNDIQKEHFDDLIRYYYEQLTSILERFNIPDLKLSYEDYLEELKRVALESEVAHAIFFSTIVFGEKGTGPDILLGEVDILDHMDYMINNISEIQKEKLIIITELSVKRGWL